MDEAVARALLLGVFAVLLVACLLLMRVSWRLLTGGRRRAPGAPRVPPSPEDWDDEEYSARHHH